MNYCRTCESSCCPGLHPLEKEGFHLHILFTQTLAQDGAFVCISFPSDLPLCLCVCLSHPNGRDLVVCGGVAESQGV